MSDDLIIFLSGASFLTFIGSIITLIFNRRESKARSENFETNTDKIRNEIIDQLRDYLMEQNKELIAQNKEKIAEIKELKTKVDELTQQAEDKDEQYQKIKSVGVMDIESWKIEYAPPRKICDMRDHNSRLIRELDNTKREYKQSTEDYIVKIGTLENKVIQQGGAIEIIAKKTDQLHLPARDGDL